MALLTQISLWIIPCLFLLIPLVAIVRRVDVFESFVEGAGEGVCIAIKILPFLVGMLVAIDVFRVSGALEWCVELLQPITDFFHIPAEVLPLAIMRPLSGSGALGITADLISTYGPDSFIGRLASTMQGSSDTTFYVLAVYFGSVGIKKCRYALTVGLTADISSFIFAVLICNLFFN